MTRRSAHASHVLSAAPLRFNGRIMIIGALNPVTIQGHNLHCPMASPFLPCTWLPCINSTHQTWAGPH